MITRYKHSSLFGLVISNEEKRFKTLNPGKIFQAILIFVKKWTPNVLHSTGRPLGIPSNNNVRHVDTMRSGF
jgi:hypothetical protein